MSFLSTLILVGELLGTATGGSPQGAASAPADRAWPVYRQNSHNTGVTPQPLKPPLASIWKKRLGSGKPGEGQRLASYVIGNRTGIYIAVGNARTGSYTGQRMTLYALRRGDGSQMWKSDGVLTTGCLVGDVLVTVRIKAEDARKDRASAPHWITGLDARTGRVRWELPAPGRGEQDAPPIFLTTDGKRVCYERERLVIVDPRRGKLVAETRLTEEGLGGGDGPPVVTDDRILAARINKREARLVDSALLFLDKQTLVARESFASGYVHPLLFDGFVASGYGGYGGTVGVKRLTDHPQASDKGWWVPSDCRFAYVPVRQGSRRLLVLFHGWDDKTNKASVVRAYDFGTGQEVWKYAPLTVTAQGAAASRIVYLPAGFDLGKPRERGGLYALDGGTGKLLWKYERPRLTFSAPAIVSDRLYAFGSDNCLYSFRPSARK